LHFYQSRHLGGSFVVGCSIHHSYARAISLWGSSLLNVTNNVAYDIYGHGIALEDGSEMDNIFDRNLIINTKSAWGC